MTSFNKDNGTETKEEHSTATENQFFFCSIQVINSCESIVFFFVFFFLIF